MNGRFTITNSTLDIQMMLCRYDALPAFVRDILLQLHTFAEGIQGLIFPLTLAGHFASHALVCWSRPTQLLPATSTHAGTQVSVPPLTILLLYSDQKPRTHAQRAPPYLAAWRRSVLASHAWPR